MTIKHFGMCDASATIALDSDHFVVANDEDNIFRQNPRRLLTMLIYRA